MIWIILVIVFILALVLYWQFIIAEGAYLGAPLVALLYDWTAERYNNIKDFDEAMETFTLGEPLASRLYRQPEALVLDVATGTGRIPLALFNQPTYRGHIIGLERASKMMAVARRDTAAYRRRLTLMQADGMHLPFASDSFPLVTCLEALEFFPDPRQGLAELIRVLQAPTAAQPDSGWLLITNRIGWEARLMPGKTWRREELFEILDEFPLQCVYLKEWQHIYDLVWMQKAENL